MTVDRVTSHTDEVPTQNQVSRLVDLSDDVKDVLSVLESDGLHVVAVTGLSISRTLEDAPLDPVETVERGEKKGKKSRKGKKGKKSRKGKKGKKQESIESGPLMPRRAAVLFEVEPVPYEIFDVDRLLLMEPVQSVEAEPGVIPEVEMIIEEPVYIDEIDETEFPQGDDFPDLDSSPEDVDLYEAVAAPPSEEVSDAEIEALLSLLAAEEAVETEEPTDSEGEDGPEEEPAISEEDVPASDVSETLTELSEETVTIEEPEDLNLDDEDVVLLRSDAAICPACGEDVSAGVEEWRCRVNAAYDFLLVVESRMRDSLRSESPVQRSNDFLAGERAGLELGVAHLRSALTSMLISHHRHIDFVLVQQSYGFLNPTMTL